MTTQTALGRSSRRAVARLASPHPLGTLMPSVYADDEFAQRFMGALDTVLAPVFCTLDSLAAYLDPRIAPVDFVEWLARWVGLDDLELDTSRRDLVTSASEIYSWRGTRRGLETELRAVTGLDVDVSDSGSVTFSLKAGARVDKDNESMVTVVVKASDGSRADRERLDALIAKAKPAHVPHVLVVRDDSWKPPSGAVAVTDGEEKRDPVLKKIRRKLVPKRSGSTSSGRTAAAKKTEPSKKARAKGIQRRRAPNGGVKAGRKVRTSGVSKASRTGSSRGKHKRLNGSKGHAR